MKIYLDNNLGVVNVEQEELTQDTIGYNILKVYIPNAVLTPYDTFTCYYGALLQNGRKVGWFAMEARTNTDADYEANYTLYKATLEQCVVSVEGKVYIGCQVLLGNSGNATLIKKNTAVVQFNVRKSVAINNDILVLDTDQTTTDVLESYKNLLENALTTYVTKAEVYTKAQVDALLLQKADKSDTYTKTEVNNIANGLSARITANADDIDTLEGNVTTLQDDVADLKSVQNVVEVVATYSALQSYDTTKLDVNDKVQVIADETHNGASTIYNWSGSAWQYVGAYGTNAAPKSTAITHTGSQLQDYSGNNIYPNLADGSVTLDSFGADVNDKIGAFNYTFEKYLGSTIVTAAFGSNPQQVRQVSISVNLLANKTYTFRIADYPNSSINFYTGSDYSSGYLGTDKRFSTIMKEFTYTPTTNITTLYLYCWADIKTYSFSISSDDGVVYDELGKLDRRNQEVIYSSEATYLNDSIVKKHSASSLLTDGTLTAGNINSYVSDFISLNEYDLKEIIYGFYEASSNIAGICCYESNNESSFIKSYRDYDTRNSNGWARGTTIPTFPSNANYIRFSGRNDQATGSPSLKVVKPLPKINKEKIAELENQIGNINASSKPKPIIFDTDFGGDIDDLTALALLLWSERIGLVDIVGIVSCGARSGTYEGTAYNEISAMDAVCNYFGVSDMAFGRNTAMATRQSNYCGTCCKWQHSITDLSNIEDSPAFYRRALTSLPKGEKCNVVVVGQTTAFSRFLSSTADEYSNLSGVELARAKIDKLVIMGGNYPNGDKETNFSAYGATPYTYNILENYPNEIIFVGNEMSGVHCGDVLLDENLTWSMLYQAMNEFMVAAYNNGDNQWGYTSLEETWHGKSYAWDCIAVMIACDNNLSVSGFRTIRGTCSINNDSESADYGKNSWVDSPIGNHYYVRRQDLRTTQWVTHRFDSIIKEDAWISRVLGRVRLPRNE